MFSLTCRRLKPRLLQGMEKEVFSYVIRRRYVALTPERMGAAAFRTFSHDA